MTDDATQSTYRALPPEVFDSGKQCDANRSGTRFRRAADARIMVICRKRFCRLVDEQGVEAGDSAHRRRQLGGELTGVVHVISHIGDVSLGHDRFGGRLAMGRADMSSLPR